MVCWYVFNLYVCSDFRVLVVPMKMTIRGTGWYCLVYSEHQSRNKRICISWKFCHFSDYLVSVIVLFCQIVRFAWSQHLSIVHIPPCNNKIRIIIVNTCQKFIWFSFLEYLTHVYVIYVWTWFSSFIIGLLFFASFNFSYLLLLLSVKHSYGR